MHSARELPHLGPLRLPEGSIPLAITRRVGLAVGLILAVAIVLWFDRDGLRDNAHPDRTPEVVDVFYFTVVSLTTVGYGDIAPVTDVARLVNALLLTPIRVFLWALFLGTAYELSVLRLQVREDRRMKDLYDRLRDHIVLCGYGVKGRAIVEELIDHGHPLDSIVAIDPSEDATAECVKRGMTALRGDASSEALLKAAAVAKAAYVLVAPNRDDACVLICLTVRNLAPKAMIIASAREEENIKLIYGAGADLVVAPSVSGGRLMAAAVRQQAVPYFLEDMLAFGKGIGVAERVVTPAEEGRHVRDLVDLANVPVVGVARGRDRVSFDKLDTFPLKAGDVIVHLSRQ